MEVTQQQKDFVDKLFTELIVKEAKHSSFVMILGVVKNAVDGFLTVKG